MPTFFAGEDDEADAGSSSTVAVLAENDDDAPAPDDADRKSAAPVALAPLRWNLQKLERERDATVAAALAETEKATTSVRAEQTKETRRLNTRQERFLTKEKAKIPLAKRLQEMANSEANLRRLGREADADGVRRRREPLEASFWAETLKDLFTQQRRERAELKVG